jgi:hypothetical protein
MVGLRSVFLNLYLSKTVLFIHIIVFVSETRRRRQERRVEVECTLFDESWKLNKNLYRKSIVR